ncbi:conserved hypothetical protein [Ixodes scapularis]|uniref:Serine-threonine/tyrosine-protein kinase catalytic domain-containing protein n=1 Tax=Ixodes scapularis TaxID=6945 RepID=B7PQH3_IXOSC|nr:conserved hypothetical protein [Ixodes scapularis]|eukprot:XP_002436015.1 conserved hypothetical protein [Ixodes scapularis]
MHLVKALGQDSFGGVYWALAYNFKPDNLVTKYAFKAVNESMSMCERIEFLQEAAVMKAFRCQQSFIH